MFKRQVGDGLNDTLFGFCYSYCLYIKLCLCLSSIFEILDVYVAIYIYLLFHLYNY